jgi:hypothetical protein
MSEQGLAAQSAQVVVDSPLFKSVALAVSCVHPVSQDPPILSGGITTVPAL